MKIDKFAYDYAPVYQVYFLFEISYNDQDLNKKFKLNI